jgi:hypothetical protein
MLRDREGFAGGLKTVQRKRQRPYGGIVALAVRVNDVPGGTVCRVRIHGGRGRDQAATFSRHLNVDCVYGMVFVHRLIEVREPPAGQIQKRRMFDVRVFHDARHRAPFAGTVYIPVESQKRIVEPSELQAARRKAP